VTTCNRCGGVLLANATICRYCGAPVMRSAARGTPPGSLGPRQRSQERWESAQPPALDPMGVFPPSSPSSAPFPAPPAGAPGRDGQGAAEQWRGPSLIDPNQLPEWLQPQPPANPAASPPARPPAQNRPPTAPMRNNSPYHYSGRRSTDDLFASSSLIDQNRLPDWLSGRDRQPPGGRPPTGRPPAPPAGSRSSARPAGEPARQSGTYDPNLPEWLRAMDPGAPPSVGHLTSGPLRNPPGNPPFGERRDQSGTGAPGTDPFSISRVDQGLPPLEHYGGLRAENDAFPTLGTGDPGNTPGQRPITGYPGAAWPSQPMSGATDPFAPRSRFGEPSGQSASPFGGAGAQQRPPQSSSRDQRRDAGMPESPSFGRRPTDPFARPADPFSASSLIDNQSLPAWLRPNSASGAADRPSRAFPPSAPKTFGAGPGGGNMSGPQPFDFGPSAGGDPGAAGSSPFSPSPRDSQRSTMMPPAGSGPSWAAPARSDAFAAPPTTSATPFDAAALVDEQSLPDWLSNRNETEPLPLPFTVSDSIGTGKAKGERGSAGSDRQRAGAGASQGSDEEALPEWLRQVYADAQVPSLSGTPPPAPLEKSKLSGSDLIDTRAVPKWLQEASQTSPLPDFPAEALWANPPVPPAAPAPSAPAPRQPSSGPGWPGANLSAGQADTASSLPPAGADGFTGRTLIDEESLPEWLRQGNTGLPPGGAAPAGPTGNNKQASSSAGSASGIFSAAELVDTQSLPAWLKKEEPAAEPKKTSAPAGQATPSGSASGIFSAAELVDTQSLPAWLRTDTPAQPAGQAQQPASPSSGSASGIFSAAELVDTQSLPAWLRAGEPTSGPARGSPADQASGPAGSTSGIFSAAELVDTQSLPAWLRADAPAAPPPSSAPAAPEGFSRGNTSKIAAIPTGFSNQQAGGLSAAELVDTQSLPAWLKGAVGDSGTPQAGQQSQPSAAESGQMSAAELVDTQSLPTWIKEANQAGSAPASGQSGEFSAASLVDPDALPPWLRAAEGGAGQSAMPAEMGSAPEQSGFSAASLIDQDQLPEWMRNPQRPGASGGLEQEEGPRAHVPRRPRQPVEPNRAPSQAAANVFSSVLGPTAGEAQTQGRRAPAQHEMTPADWGSMPRPPSAPGQSGEWGSPDAGARPQPSRPPSKPQQGFFEGEPGRGFDPRAGAQDEWQAAGNNLLDAQGAGPADRWPAGQMPPAQRPWQQEVSGEWGVPQGQPGRWQGNMGMPAGSFGQAERGGPPGFDEGAYAPPQPQRRGKQPPPLYDEADGWENVPGYDAGAAGDDDVGPPSGVFAKIKRVLGFGR
jgi:hypothetical protein